MLKLKEIKKHKRKKIKNYWNNNWKEHTAYHLYDSEHYTDIVFKVFKDGTLPELSANQRFSIDQSVLDQLSTYILESKSSLT